MTALRLALGHYDPDRRALARALDRAATGALARSARGTGPLTASVAPGDLLALAGALEAAIMAERAGGGAIDALLHACQDVQHWARHGTEP